MTRKKTAKKARQPSRKFIKWPTQKTDWEDATLELYAPGGVACSMPVDCAECEGQVWIGEEVCAVSRVEIVHLFCFADYAKRWGWEMPK